ncbi:hypothetical protein C8F04DRAFT_1178435 [Mycena alexandri]|uniref:F-box domain-containing protein n=1 Tax=Mycena alexandri TaxID=1745969 RepID=A0AAD6T797_9AGAR|nr:hypothetical protein C8F04DRAFT_1178435 [Mycena alexandri]
MEGKVWCCQGVLKEEAQMYGIPSDIPSYIFLGQERVGGCLRAYFTKRELEIHLGSFFCVCESALVGRRAKKAWPWGLYLVCFDGPCAPMATLRPLLNIRFGPPRAPFLTVPVDVLFLILHLLTITDVLSFFETCKLFYQTSLYRPFWVYANIDMDNLQFRSGRSAVNYSRMDLSALRQRVVKAWRIFDSWGSRGVEPRHTHSVPLSDDVRNLVAIPGTRVLVLLCDDRVYLQDWLTGSSTEIQVHRLDDRLYLTSVKHFWVDIIGRNVLVLYLAARGVACVAAVVLFGLTPSPGTVDVPTIVSGFMLSNNDLVVFGTTGGRPHFLCSFVVSYATTPGSLSASSIAILDRTHFLLANPTGITIYNLSEKTLASVGSHVRRIRPCWEHRYGSTDFLSRPPLGPVLTNPADGGKSVSVCGGTYLRCVYMAPVKGNKRFRIAERTLIDRVPVYLGIAAGSRVGLYRRPWTSQVFTTFRLPGGSPDLHPFSYEVAGRRDDKGSIAYAVGMQETLEPNTLHVDEVEGRIVFMLRMHGRRSAKAVILELF